jgi:hypothetical protein
VAASAALLSLLSIVLAVPLVAALNRWVPQLVGRPTADGPLLPRLLEESAARRRHGTVSGQK